LFIDKTQGVRTRAIQKPTVWSEAGAILTRLARRRPRGVSTRPFRVPPLRAGFGRLAHGGVRLFHVPTPRSVLDLFYLLVRLHVGAFRDSSRRIALNDCRSVTSDVGDLRQAVWHTLFLMKFARFVAAVWLYGFATGVAAQAEDPPTPAESTVVPSPEEQAADADTLDAAAVDEAAIEADIVSQELSDEAKDRLDAARDAVVQIRGFFEGSDSSAFHGSGFAVDDGRRIVTNYHVVAQAVLYPRQYRLEYLASDGRTGRLHVLAIDVRNDLAIAAAEDLALPPLVLRTEIPAQGERAWSIGFPLNLGLTITEGVANGLVENSIEQRIHYTGAINGGMSGGPALDKRGRVYGVNVSVVTGRQLVGFVVPAKHIPALLARAMEPLDQRFSALQLRQLVTAQVLAYESEVLEARPDTDGTQSARGYVLPTQISRHAECNTFDEPGPHVRVRVETISCRIPSQLVVQAGVPVAGLSVQHRVLQSAGLHPLQFERQVNDFASSVRRTGIAAHVAPFACHDGLVSLDGFDARISTCVRQYRLFSDLYDFDVTVVSLDDMSQALVSRLALQGVAFELGERILQRYLGDLQWKP
jgi:S1-C subfamily serine protease